MKDIILALAIFAFLLFAILEPVFTAVTAPTAPRAQVYLD